MTRSSHPSPALLCVANYATNTGYAWDFIERLYASVADALAPEGIRTFVAYPAIHGAPRTLEGSRATAIQLDARLRDPSSVRAVARFVRRNRVDVAYLTDLPVRSLAYAALRAAGLRRLVVHDHTSGDRTEPTGVRRMAKRAWAAVPGVTADVVLAVSDFVARRQTDVSLVSAARVQRVWNGLSLPAPEPGARSHVAAELGLPADRPWIVSACRAAPEKGVDYLLRAFDLLVGEIAPAAAAPILIYVGDGPALPTLERVRGALKSSSDIHLVGYRSDAQHIVAAADMVVVPSVWQDALPLSVLEAQARGRPVIGTAVGGVPEMILHDETGLLVPPRDEHALAQAMGLLLADPDRGARLGHSARERVGRLFTPDAQVRAIVEALRGPVWPERTGGS